MIFLSLCGRFNDGQAAPLLGDHPSQEIPDFPLLDLPVDFREAEVIKIGKMVSADPEAGGVKAVQAPDASAQGTALHPQEVPLRHALPDDFLRLRQDGLPNLPGLVAVSGAQHVLRLALREYIYVELSNKAHKLFVKFGYDYYLNVACSLSNEVLEDIVRKEKLFLDPR